MKISIMNNAPSTNKGNQQHTNKNEISFKGINIIYVPIDELKRPHDRSACIKEIDKIINKKNCLYSFITKVRNIGCILKTKGREYIESEMRGFFVDIKPKTDYYGFCVITGKEKERLGKEITLFNVFRMSRKFDNRGSDGSCIKAIKYIQNRIVSDFEKLPKHIIEVKSLSELNSIKLVK